MNLATRYKAAVRVPLSYYLTGILLLGVQVAQAAPSKPLPTIRWDSANPRLIQKGGDYGRMVRLGDKAIACAFDWQGKMWIRRSTDEAKTWSEPTLVAQQEECWLTNAELLPIADGTLLYFWNERPLKAVRLQHQQVAPGTLTRPFLIRMATSRDHGVSWSKPVTLHTAGTSFGDGCWEPAGIRLPSGEIHVYFADETPFTSSNEQQISLVRSADGGKTWSSAKRVIFRAGHRDGMPAPLLLAGSKGIVIAIEDEGVAGRRFKPSICYTPLSDAWKTGAAGGESTNRWSALAEPLPPEWYAGAPCLRQLPGGETLLSFQENPDGTLATCRMAVCVGDAYARGFTNKSYPLPRSMEGTQLWNSLFVKDQSTVVAVLTATVNGVRGVWSVEGKLSRSGGGQ